MLEVRHVFDDGVPIDMGNAPITRALERRERLLEPRHRRKRPVGGRLLSRPVRSRLGRRMESGLTALSGAVSVTASATPG